MGRVLVGVLVLIMLTGCSQPISAPDRPEKEDIEKAAEEPPKVKGPGYEVVEIVPLEKADPDFYHGPIEDSGIPAAEVKVQVDGEGAIPDAYNDAASSLTDYDIMVVNFYKEDEILDFLFFFRTQEAQQAYADEAMGNLQQLTTVSAPPSTPPGSAPTILSTPSAKP